MFIDELLDFLRKEHEYVENKKREILQEDMDVLIDKGESIECHAQKRENNKWLFKTKNHTSKLKPGDELYVLDGETVYSSKIIELSGQDIRIFSKRDFNKNNKYFFIRKPVDVTSIIKSALSKLTPGVPGWAQIQAIQEGKEFPQASLSKNDRADIFRLVEIASKMLRLKFYPNQIEILQDLLQERYLNIVWGPPGTGKTVMLAVVAKLYAQMGKKVLITAPTHQAVNNALNTINNLFPEQRVIKVGDELMTESLNNKIECTLWEVGSRKNREIVSNEFITGMTYLSAITHLVLKKSALMPTVFIIDEAGQLPMHQGILYGMIGSGINILFGDDMQMPPVFPSDLANEKHATSIFKFLRQNTASNVHLIKKSFRMNKQLCNVIGKVFYKDKQGHSAIYSNRDDSEFIEGLKASENIILREVGKNKKSFVWLCHDDMLSTQVNNMEAKIIAHLVKELCLLGIGVEDIAVVTPYRRQVQLLKDSLLNQIGIEIPIVDTVERVQGMTVQVVIYSFCKSYFLESEEENDFLFSKNRINVALSRAKDLSIMIASNTALDAAAKNDNYSFFTELYELAYNHKVIQ